MSLNGSYASGAVSARAALSSTESESSSCGGSEAAAAAEGSAAWPMPMWELPAPRFGPFAHVTFEQLEDEWNAANQPAMQQQRSADPQPPQHPQQPPAAKHARSSPTTTPAVAAKKKTPPAAQVRAAASKSSPGGGEARVGVHVPLPPNLPPTPCDFDDMLASVAEKGDTSGKRVAWFEWARQSWGVLRTERAARLPNRVLRMKNNVRLKHEPMIDDAAHLPPPRTHHRTKAEPRAPPTKEQSSARASPMPSNKPRTSPALANRLHMPVQVGSVVAVPAVIATKILAPALKEDTLHRDWSAKPLPAVSAAVRSSAEFGAFCSFPQASLGSALLLWDFLHVYSKQMPLDFPLEKLTLQAFLEAFLVPPIAVPLPPPLSAAAAVGADEEVAQANRNGSNNSSPQKRRGGDALDGRADSGSAGGSWAAAAAAPSPTPSDGLQSRADTPAVPANARAETPAPAAHITGADVPVQAAKPEPADAAASADGAPASVKQEPAEDTEMKDADSVAAAAVPSAATAAAAAAVVSTSPAPALAASRALPPLLRPSEIRESHILNSVMAVITRCLFSSTGTSADFQRVVNRLTWPEFLRQWLQSEDTLGTLRGLRDVSNLLAVDSFYYLSVPKRLQLVEVLLEHIFSGHVMHELLETGVRALADAKVAANRAKSGELASKRQQERDMGLVAEALHGLLEQVVASAGGSGEAAKDASGGGLSLSVALNSKNGLCTQGLRLLQNSYDAAREKQAQLLLEVEQACPVRTEPLGLDRFKNRYWALANARRGANGPKQPRHLFVELCGSRSPMGTHGGLGEGATWLYYSTEAEFKQLLSYLNTYGLRERALKEALTRENWAFITPRGSKAAAAVEVKREPSTAAAAVDTAVKLEGVEQSGHDSSTSAVVPVAAAASDPLTYSYESCMALNLPLLRASEILRKADNDTALQRCSICQDALPTGQRHCDLCHRTWEAGELNDGNFAAHLETCRRDGGKNRSAAANPGDVEMDAAEHASGSVIDEAADAAQGYVERRLFLKRASRPLHIVDQADEQEAQEDDGDGTSGAVPLFDEDEYEPEAEARPQSTRPTTPANAAAESTAAVDETGDESKAMEVDGEPTGDEEAKAASAPKKSARVERRFKRLTPLATCLSDVSLSFHQLKAMLFDLDSAIPVDAMRGGAGSSSRSSSRVAEKQRMLWIESLKLSHSIKQLVRATQQLAGDVKAEWVRSWFKFEDWSKTLSTVSTEAQLAASLFALDKALLYSADEQAADAARRRSGADVVHQAAGSSGSDGEEDEEAGEGVDLLSGCMVCGVTKPNRTLTCETCERDVHMTCLKPPIKSIPKGRFDCSSCKRRIQREMRRGRSLEEAQQAAAKLARLHNNRVSRKQQKHRTASEDDPTALPNGGVCMRCNVSKGADDDPLLCDGCNSAYHLHCLQPALDEPPEGEWFCPVCTGEAPAASRRRGGKSGGARGGRGGGRGGANARRPAKKARKNASYFDDEAGESDEDASDGAEHEMSATGRVIYKTDSEAEEDEEEEEEEEEVIPKPKKRAPPAAAKGKGRGGASAAARKRAAAAKAKARRTKKRARESSESSEEESSSDSSSSSSSATSSESESAAPSASPPPINYDTDSSASSSSSNASSGSSSSSDDDDDTGKQDEPKCTVCFAARTDGLCTCDGCEITAHRACVGAGDGEFLCAACSTLGGADASCELCPLTSKEGVMAPLADAPGKPDAMAHYACIDWMPGLTWNADKSAAAGMPYVDAARSGQTCNICKKSRGLTLACSAAGCAQKMHVLCALRRRGYTLTREGGAQKARCPAHGKK